MARLSAKSLLDLAALFEVDITKNAQLWEAEALLAAAWPAGMPAAGAQTDTAVRSYAETQGLGPYAPPAAPFPLAATTPAIIWWDAGAPELAPHLVTLLRQRYPATHTLQLASLEATGAALTATELSLNELAALSPQPSALSPQPSSLILHPSFFVLALPALAAGADRRTPEALAWVMARLLGPGGCPWDVRQTHRSLRGALLEEVYEVLEALDAGDMPALSEELGDIMIAVFGHSEMARQAGHFDLGDVFAGITGKLIGRHPHVFGDLTVSGEGQVLQNWEQIKAAELAAKGRSRTSALDGVPPALPALAAAQELGKKAARAGFNWSDQAGVWAKLREELDELAVATTPAELAEELGDTLFVLTRLADWMHVDAEMALRDANAKFRRRFAHLEATATAQGRPLASMDLATLLALWREAKGIGDAETAA
jgi:tetrapyrrole methylase family protein/MazG family protein